MRPAWAIDPHPGIADHLDVLGWTVFVHMGRMESWNEAVAWCADRLGDYNEGDARWMPHGITDRLAIRDPNDAFEFRMRWC